MATKEDEKSRTSPDWIQIGLEHFDSEDEEDLEFHSFDLIRTKIITNSTHNKSAADDCIGPIDLDKFLAENYDSKIVKVRVENFDAMKRPLIIAFHDFNSSCACLKQRTDELYQEALKYECTIQFTIADYAEIVILKIRSSAYVPNHRFQGHHMPHGEIYGIDVENRKFHCVGSLTKFCEKFHRGELFFSELLPASNEELVKVGVANNLEALVGIAERDVFINFYAPWCLFSKELLPCLIEVAALLKDESVLIVKINAEANYVPLEYNVFCYPKCIFIPRDDKKKLVEYAGGPRTLENLIKFIASNATVELKAYDREGRPKT